MFLFTGCSSLKALDWITTRRGYQPVITQSYGSDLRQAVDVYRPVGASKKSSLPVVIFFYGGNWQEARKEDYRFIGQALASKNIIAVIADVRLYPQARYPVFLQDGAQAIKWVHHHIASYGGDTGRVFTMGHSSGAYNAVMLAVNPLYLKEAGGGESWLKGSVGLSGPYDFLPLTDEETKRVFSSEKNLILTQPIHYITSKRPDLLLLTGDKDTRVKPENTINLAKKLEKYGSSAAVKIYPGLDHIDPVLALADKFRHKAPVLNDIADFIKSKE